MIPTYDYSIIRYRHDQDSNYKGELNQEGENKQENAKDQKDKSNGVEEESQIKQKLQRRKDEIKSILENMRYMQNNMGDRKTQNFKQQTEEKVLVDYFLNSFEFQEMNRNYNDYNMGNILLVFPNPDKPDHAKAFAKPPFVKFSDAEEVFDSFLRVIQENGFTQSQLVQERKAFLYSFLMLDNAIIKTKSKEQKKKAPQKSKVDENNLKEVEKKKNIQKLKEDDPTKDVKEETPKETKKKKEETPWEKYEKALEQYTKSRLNSKGEFTGFNLTEEKELTNYLMDVPLNETNQFKDVKKKLAGGGYLSQYQEGTLYASDWTCKNGRPKDFLTLIRFTIQTKLSKNANFHTRCFLSESGEDIYMVLKGNEKDFDVEAEASGLTKQLELGYSDLLSLEPCDSRYRPLRLKKQITSCVNEIMNDKTFSHKDPQQGGDGGGAKKKTLRNFRRIEDRTKMLYDVVKKWNTDLFWTNLALKQIKVNKFLNELSERLNINRDFEKAEILDGDDDNTTREEWEAYFVYLDYLMYFQKKMQNLHKVAKFDLREKKLRKFDLVQQNEAFLYKLIFRKALGDTNEVFHLINGSLSSKQVLMNIWDYLETRPISAFVDYFQTNNEKASFIWRRYEINEKKNRSKYLNMEKIKLTYSMIVKQIDLDGLQKTKLYLKTFLAIHDPYQLKGNLKAPLFQNLVLKGIVEDEIITETEKEIRDLFKELEDEAEGADFDAESVQHETEFDIKKPWDLQVDSIRDYFGEKIALYFTFVQFFTYHLSYLGVIGIILQIIRSVRGDVDTQFYINTIFAALIVIWSTLFVEFWRRQQILFSIEFGQQDFEEDEAERPEFKGIFQRSIVNDKINEKYFSPAKRRAIMTAGIGGSFFIIFLVVLVMYQIFTYKKEWKANPPAFVGANADVFLNIMNSVSIVVFTIIYEQLANFLNKVENHKILSSYENSYIAKLFLFQFFNTFNSLILIAFFNSTQPFDTLLLCTVINKGVSSQDCFGTLQTQIITIFLTMIIKTLLEFIQPFAIQKIMKMLQKKLFKRVDLHPFEKIDQQIESQTLLNPYITNEDLDGTVGDYLQLVIKFSFLTLFGLSFPPTFAIAFVNNSMEMQMDKLKLLNLYQRPIPKGASNIGTWQVTLDTISFIAIFANAGTIFFLICQILNFNIQSTGLIIYTSQYRERLTSDQAVVQYVFMLIGFLILKYFVSFIIPDTPEKALIINKRNQVAVERIIKGFKKRGTSFYTVGQMNNDVKGIQNQKAKIKQK